jgi:hypothetical protein
MICENNDKINNKDVKIKPSLLSQCVNNSVKLRTNSDDDYNNIVQKQKDEVQRILNSSNKTSVNENSFDPSKSSPPNDFMRKLQNRFHKYSINNL